MAVFSGSYPAEDVTLLLQPVQLAPTDVAEKERLIQSGARHYSEMLTAEAPPAPDYLRIYHQALDRNAAFMAAQTMALARGLAAEIEGEIVLASLVRAGLPLGVLLHRALRRLGRVSHHYGISIIRDRGLDRVALGEILARHGHHGLVFVDGWTGKGAIAGELARDWPNFGPGTARLAVLSDVGGFAWMAPGARDWLIPSGILGGVVSGLVSRSVLNGDILASGGYHGCTDLSHLSDHDVSTAFVDRIWAEMQRPANWDAAPCPPTPQAERRQRRARVAATVDALAVRHGVDNLNRIKPGIAEATRAILRRRPRQVYLSGTDDADLSAIRHLIARDGLPAENAPDLLGCFSAVTLIEKTS